MPTAASATSLAEAPLAAIRTIARWYRETVYGRFEGPGTVPFYCDPARVGHFAVAPGALGRGDAAALFRLFVVLTMYQSRRDVDIMRRQRETSRKDAAGLATARELGRRIVAIRAVGRDAEVFEATLAAARARADGSRVDAQDLRRAVGLWDDAWGALTPREQARVMALLVEDVAYDGATGSAALTFRPSGIRALAKEAAR